MLIKTRAGTCRSTFTILNTLVPNLVDVGFRPDWYVGTTGTYQSDFNLKVVKVLSCSTVPVRFECLIILKVIPYIQIDHITGSIKYEALDT